ncbi:MAG: phosphorylcholine transferase LicD [Prevotella sp.]
MLQELQEVCRRHGLRLFAEGGTLMGVARHRGYIPWDDDIDLAMPRADYDKLVEIGPKEFRNPYFFQNVYTDTLYLHRHSQIRNTNTFIWFGDKQEARKKRSNQGVFIDIFPLDIVPARLRDIDHYLRDEKILKLRLKITSKILSRLPFAVYRYFRNRRGFLSDITYMERYEAHLRKWCHLAQTPDSRNSASKVFLCSVVCTQRHVPVKDWAPYLDTVEMPFEHLSLLVPKNYDHVLTVQYGDWRTPVKSASTHGSFEWEIIGEQGANNLLPTE